MGPSRGMYEVITNICMTSIEAEERLHPKFSKVSSVVIGCLCQACRGQELGHGPVFGAHNASLRMLTEQMVHRGLL